MPLWHIIIVLYLYIVTINIGCILHLLIYYLYVAINTIYPRIQIDHTLDLGTLGAFSVVTAAGVATTILKLTWLILPPAYWTE